MTIIGAVSKLFFAQDESDKDHPATQGAFGKLLSKGHGASLARQTETIKYLKATAGQSGESASGDATLEGKPCKWREFRWPSEAKQDECSWRWVRWRFYENGLVCFDAQMANASTGVDLGDLQGHRIELRDKTGFLLGIWIAGFFVRRRLPPLGFQANILDDHMPFKLHFSELADVQTGMWLLM